ncbi:MAG TPA: M14 family metallopeptidase [Thiobacillaceae bacterium]|nr:M14 family metallopeptidase [Thiobacillaceae bacterium]
MLTELDHLPEGFLHAQATELHRILPGPTLIHLPGRRPETLFVSILLHGNEDTGLLAIQSLLHKYTDQPLPRALSVFVGNIEAARHGLRRLDNQQDYNRVWPGAPGAAGDEHRLMQEVLNRMAARGVFASIDLHNNTGRNPHYACINRLQHRFIHLALLFSRTVVYFTQPAGVQSAAFASLCPAVTVECGKPGTVSGMDHAAGFVEAALHLSGFPAHPVPHQDVDLLHTVATVKLPGALAFSVGKPGTDLTLIEDIDHFNFRELPAGTLLGQFALGPQVPLDVTDNNGKPLAERYFEVRNGQLLTRRPVMPAMLTRDERIIRQDCLCYLMERIEIAQVKA